MKINVNKSLIIGIIVTIFANYSDSVFAQTTTTAQTTTADAGVEETIGGRVYVGLKYHVPFLQNNKLCFLGHYVLDNKKGDLVDNDKTKWVTIAAPTRRMARKLKKMNKPFLADYVLVPGKTTSYYLISNWQPTVDKVDDKIK